MAKLRADAQNQVAEQTRADILLVTGQTYFAVLRGQAVMQVAQQTVAARQLVADQITALAQSNLKSALDVSFANVNLADAKLLLLQAENSLKAAQAQLAAVLVLPGDSSFVLADEPMPEPLSDQYDSLIQQALLNRPELKGLHLEQSAAEKFVRAEHALHYPNIGILGTAGIVPIGQAQIPDRYGAIGINLNIPIFNGWLFKARESEAELRAQAAQQRANVLENELARDVRVACLNERTARERMGLTEQLLKQSQTALDLAQSRYSLGLSSIIELSQSQLSLTSAQIAVASAKYDYQAQRLNVDFQIGALK
jgi:outer membrane protein